MRPDDDGGPEFEFFKEDFIALVSVDITNGVIAQTFTPPEFPELITLYAGQRLEFVDTDANRTVIVPYAHQQTPVHIVWHSTEQAKVEEEGFDERIKLEHSHPSLGNILRFFTYEHLPQGKLRETSALLSELAQLLAEDEELQGPELTVGLRKLLEAKDCFVRAAL